MFSEKRPWTLAVLLLLLVSAAFATPSESDVATRLAAPALDQSVSIKIEEPTSVFAVYRSFGKLLGLDILFAPSMKDTKVTFSIDEMSGHEGLRLAGELFGHFYKVIDEKTILVVDDTPQNRRQHEEQAIATFYLENARLQDVMTVLRSLLGAKNIADDERLNAITLRDRAEVMGLAAEIVRRMDVPSAEVAVAVEVLEISSDELAKLRQKLAGDGPGGGMRLSQDELDRIRTAESARHLARPRLVAQAGREAHVTLGERTPIGSPEAGNLNYQDVGLALEVRPRVHPTTQEVTLDMALDLSRVAEGSARETPVVTTRNFKASFRLGDDEVLLFSGIPVTDSEQGKVRALGDTRREVLVAVSADLVRLPDPASRQPQVVKAGTETFLGLRQPGGEEPK